MRKLSVFNQITLDGYFTDAKNDMRWAHGDDDPEWQEFTAGNAGSGGELLFGRVTYEMMVSYWPTPQATKDNPQVAKGMNETPKIVFSKTLRTPSWNNTRLVNGNLASAVRELKREAGPDMVILGSGTIVAQLAQEKLIDSYQLIVKPIVLGSGRTLFEGVKHALGLKLTQTRAFGNGSVLLGYQLAA